MRKVYMPTHPTPAGSKFVAAPVKVEKTEKKEVRFVKATVSVPCYGRQNDWFRKGAFSASYDHQGAQFWDE